MTRRLRPLVDALVYGFAEVSSLEGKKESLMLHHFNKDNRVWSFSFLFSRGKLSVLQLTRQLGHKRQILQEQSNC